MRIVALAIFLTGLHHILRPLYRPLGKLLVILGTALVAGYTFGLGTRRAWRLK